MNFDHTINIMSRPSIKYVGFALNILEVGFYRKKSIVDNKKEPKKRINLFENIEKIISSAYVENEICVNLAQSESSQ